MEHIITNKSKHEITTDVDDILEIARRVKIEFFNNEEFEIVFRQAVRAYLVNKYYSYPSVNLEL